MFLFLGVEEFTTDIIPLNIHKCEDQDDGSLWQAQKRPATEVDMFKVFHVGEKMPLIAETYEDVLGLACRNP